MLIVVTAEHRSGRVLRRGRRGSAQLQEQQLPAQHRLEQVCVQRRDIRGGRGLQGLSYGPHVHERGEDHVPSAHIPGQHQGDSVQAVHARQGWGLAVLWLSRQ